MVERMVNKMALIWWRYLIYLQRRTHFSLIWRHSTLYTSTDLYEWSRGPGIHGWVRCAIRGPPIGCWGGSVGWWLVPSCSDIAASVAWRSHWTACAAAISASSLHGKSENNHNERKIYSISFWFDLIWILHLNSDYCPLHGITYSRRCPSTAPVELKRMLNLTLSISNVHVEEMFKWWCWKGS